MEDPIDLLMFIFIRFSLKKDGKLNGNTEENDKK
jgi:hypothetical protein